MTAVPPEEQATGSRLTLRDELALDRTLLANERTLLAYIRTALALLIVGLTFLHFIETGFLRAAGMVFIPAGLLAGAIGMARFLRVKRAIAQARRN